MLRISRGTHTHTKRSRISFSNNLLSLSTSSIFWLGYSPLMMSEIMKFCAAHLPASPEPLFPWFQFPSQCVSDSACICPSSTPFCCYLRPLWDLWKLTLKRYIKTLFPPIFLSTPFHFFKYYYFGEKWLFGKFSLSGLWGFFSIVAFI